MCQPAGVRIGSDALRTGSLSIAASSAGSSVPGRIQPRSPPFWAVAPCENCWARAANGAPRRSCSTMRSALRGLVGLVVAVDRDEDLADPRLGLADVAAHAGQRIVDFGVGDVDLGPDPAAHDLQPGDRGLDLLGGDLVGHADALQVLLELAGRQAGGAFDLADALGDLAFGRRAGRASWRPGSAAARRSSAAASAAPGVAQLGLSSWLVVRMAKMTRCFSSKSVMASSLTGHDTQRLCRAAVTDQGQSDGEQGAEEQRGH